MFEVALFKQFNILLCSTQTHIELTLVNKFIVKIVWSGHKVYEEYL